MIQHVPVLSHFSRVQLFTTSWTIVQQAALSMDFSRHEYSELPRPPAGDLPDPEIKPESSEFRVLQAEFLCTEPPGKPK